MATILPEQSLLPTILEGTFSKVVFTVSPDVDEVISNLVMKIESKFPEYIQINNDGYEGTFSNLFELPENSLKFRQELEYGQVSKFSDLPEKGTADLYSYTAPSIMIKNYTVKVVASYTNTTTSEQLNISKEYIQPIQGNWSTFINQFLAYVR